MLGASHLEGSLGPQIPFAGTATTKGSGTPDELSYLACAAAETDGAG